ncbi:MAG TPA: ribosome-associated translation inhibitor RaiA [Stellaceae bacterium]|jgi:ribosomal subunit interface protein|nr:ribosome-associated translation inhibitor RaiA [Stellaceae bacterium]
MHITVTGKQIDVGDALRRHTQAAIENIAEKYFGNALEAHVVFSREAHLIQCDLQVHVGRGILVRSEADANEAYAAFDIAAERIDKRLRRYKRRLRDHHAHDKERERAEPLGRTYVLQPGDNEDAPPPEDEHPQAMVIAEMETPIPQLSVSEAVMRLDLADLPALMFRNSARGSLNVIYRRRDGNIGWIDPGLPRQRRRNASS